MDELKEYVRALFRHQPKTLETEELRAEILSNMQAHCLDLMAQGLPEAEAVAQAKAALPSVDGLVEDAQLTQAGAYAADCALTALLYSALFWILSLPLFFTGARFVPWLGLLLTAAAGIVWLCLRRCRTADAFLSVRKSARRKRMVWLLWTAFAIVSCAVAAAVLFGSNLWFQRPVTVSGPYQAAQLASWFYAPLLTVALPLCVSSCDRRLRKFEKRNDDE